MTGWKLKQFGGETPKFGTEDIQDAYSQISNNVDYYSTDLVPYKRSSFVENCPENTKTIFPLYNDDGTITWVKLPVDANIVSSPISDTNQRFYVTGYGSPKVSNKDLYPTFRNLGIPKPTSTPVATLGGGGSPPALARIYVYTLVSDFGEEGQPSDASNIVNANDGETVTVSGLQTTNPLGQAITKKRIYRSGPPDTSTPGLLFVAEIPLSQSSYIDTTTFDDLGELLVTTDYAVPPSGMQGLISIPNGIFIGFVGKDIYFSEPYLPYTYPRKYVLSVDYNIVGLCPIGGTSFVIATDQYPLICSGNSPDVMTIKKTEIPYPCANKRSITDVGFGCVYASNAGLIFTDLSGARLITEEVHDFKTFLPLEPISMIGAFYDGKYFASYIGGSLVYDTKDSNYISNIIQRFNGAYYENKTNTLYFIWENAINKMDDSTQRNLITQWKSKTFRLSEYTNLGACRVIGDYTNAMATMDSITQQNNENLTDITGAFNTKAFNARFSAFNGSQIQSIPDNRDVCIFLLYVNKRLIFRRYLTNDLIFRLPAGYKSDVFEFEIRSNIRVREVHIGDTPQTLRGL